MFWRKPGLLNAIEDFVLGWFETQGSVDDIKGFRSGRINCTLIPRASVFWKNVADKARIYCCAELLICRERN